MRSALGQMTLDKTFAEREALNAKIVEAINNSSKEWGIVCMRYEIRDITPPSSVRHAMDMQAEAERKKRAQILESEGVRESEINIAEGQRQASVLQAQGEAQATLARAQATARATDMIAEAINKSGGQNAVSLRVAEQYVQAFGMLAKKSNTLVIPSNPGDPAAMVTQALTLYNKIVGDNSGRVGGGAISAASGNSARGSGDDHKSSGLDEEMEAWNTQNAQAMNLALTGGGAGAGSTAGSRKHASSASSGKTSTSSAGGGTTRSSAAAGPN